MRVLYWDAGLNASMVKENADDERLQPENIRARLVGLANWQAFLIAFLNKGKAANQPGTKPAVKKRSPITRKVRIQALYSLLKEAGFRHDATKAARFIYAVLNGEDLKEPAGTDLYDQLRAPGEEEGENAFRKTLQNTYKLVHPLGIDGLSKRVATDLKEYGAVEPAQE